MEVVKTLAQHIVFGTFNRPPSSVREQASCCILDAVTAAVAGYGSPAATVCRTRAKYVFGDGRSPVWLAGRTLNAVGAAFTNSAAMSALDFDDGHRKARGHPGAAVIPAALAAIGVDCPSSSDALVSAVVAGYEISIRVAAAQNPLSIKTRQSGRWTAFGAVTAAASINGCSVDTIAAAMATAGCWSPNQQANGSSGYSRQTGNHAKEGIPWSVVTGMTALDLAGGGFTGPGDILDHTDYFNPSIVLGGLGHRWEILGVYFKPYSCCRYIHPAIDAVVKLMNDHKIRSSDVQAIHVRTFDWAKRLQNSCSPVNLVEIQYSLPFCVAAVVRYGVACLAPIDQNLLRNQDVERLASRVSLDVDPEIDGRFPAETLAQVAIQTKRGTVASGIVSPRGDAGDPINWDGLIDKFRLSTSRLLSEERQAQFIDAFDSLRSGHCGPLLAQLNSPMGTRTAS